MTALDTNVVVAALMPWHEYHPRARPFLANLLSSEGADIRLVLPIPVLLESYSVLTRLPSPSCLAGKVAQELLDQTFRGRADLSVFSPLDSLAFLARCAEQGVAGGRLYDAVILACAEQAGARRLATFNRRHFERLQPQLEIIEP